MAVNSTCPLLGDGGRPQFITEGRDEEVREGAQRSGGRGRGRDVGVSGEVYRSKEGLRCEEMKGAE